VIHEELAIDARFLAMRQDQAPTNPHTRLLQTQTERFDDLGCNRVWDNTCAISEYACHYRDVLQISRYSIVDSLTGERHQDHQLL
jgi:hypothetical protein